MTWISTGIILYRSVAMPVWATGCDQAACTTAAKSAGLSDRRTAMTSALHVLIVDDHRAIRDALTRYPEKNGPSRSICGNRWPGSRPSCAGPRGRKSAAEVSGGSLAGHRMRFGRRTPDIDRRTLTGDDGTGLDLTTAEFRLPERVRN